MCGRHVIYGPKSRHRPETRDLDELEFFGKSLAFPAHYNAAPTQRLPVYRVHPDRGPELTLLRWGLIPSWAKEASIGSKLINARGETVAEKPSFRTAFKRRRCLVPMNGFYEWKGVAGKKVPHFIYLMNDPVFAVAGLHEWWKSPEGDELETFTILTTDANAAMAPLHNRMPVIVPPERYEAWCDPANQDMAQLQSFIEPYPPDEMHAYPVSTRVNSVKNDDESLVEAAPAVV